MKYSILFLLFLLLACCSHSPNTPPLPYQVNYRGALKNIMHKGDLSAQQNLKEYAEEEHLYALGAIAGLKGEIQVFDSQPYHSLVSGDSLLFDTTYEQQATLFVSAKVAEWANYPIPINVESKTALEEHIKKIAQQHGIDINQPFPFLVEGKIASADWHVINWPEGDTEHSHKKHITSGLNGTIEQQEVILLGFYSDSHHAIFTHHTTNMHIHIKLKNGKIAGHLDELKLGNHMVLKLPMTTQ